MSTTAKSASPATVTDGRIEDGGDRHDLSAIAELSAKHCIFCSGNSRFALSATSVREVCLAPPLVKIPHAPNSLAGLCHIRSEFVPVVELNSMLSDHRAVGSEHHTLKQLLILSSSIGPWALLIDQVIAIDSIETHVDAGHRNDGHLAPILGTASYETDVVRVLNPTALHRAIAQSLDAQWSPLAAPQPLLKSPTTPKTR